MAEEVHYVYAVTTTSDVPYVECYRLLARMKSGARVLKYGCQTLIRNRRGLQLFFTEEALKAFFTRHVTAKLETHKRGVYQCEEALIAGISVHHVPVAAPGPAFRGVS